MPGEVDQHSVVVDAAAGFADDDRLHAVVKDLMRMPPIASNAAHMAAQNRLHVLVQDKPRSDQPAEAGAQQMPF